MDEQADSGTHKGAIVARPLNEARGHTGYLTFARRIIRENGTLEQIQPEVQTDAVGEAQA